MNIIFLDIDGVLNLYCESRDEYGCTFHQQFVNNLKTIIDQTNAKIVISSTWRHSGFEIMQEMWKYRNLPGEVISITPYLQNKKRGEEIKKWLDSNTIENYVIIDDDIDFLNSQLNYFVRTAQNFDHTDHIEGYGLTKQCTIKAINILNNNIIIKRYNH